MVASSNEGIYTGKTLRVQYFPGEGAVDEVAGLVLAVVVGIILAIRCGRLLLATNTKVVAETLLYHLILAVEERTDTMKWYQALISLSSCRYIYVYIYHYHAKNPPAKRHSVVLWRAC